MPKKTRKMKQRAAMRRTLTPEAEQTAEQTIAAPQETTVRMRPTASASNRTNTPLTFDYSYIYSDLKRIAAFAGFFFALLIILSFVIK